MSGVINKPVTKTRDIRVCVVRDKEAKKYPLPEYETEGSAGVDIRSTKEIVLLPGERAAVPTGLHLAIPEGYEAQLRPRSGIALQYGVTLLNSPGTIDSDYRGEVSVIMINHGCDPFTINEGDRIAQLVFSPVLQVEIAERQRLTTTKRGRAGFGSTGSA